MESCKLASKIAAELSFQFTYKVHPTNEILSALSCCPFPAMVSVSQRWVCLNLTRAQEHAVPFRANMDILFGDLRL